MDSWPLSWPRSTTPSNIQVKEAATINKLPIELEEDEIMSSPNTTASASRTSTGSCVSAKAVLMLSFAQQFLPVKAEQDVRTILPSLSWELIFACLIIVLTAALWYNTIHFTKTKLFGWYEDLALYKQGALVATMTMLMVILGMKAKVSQNSECLAVLLGAMMIMMIVKRIDEKTATTFHVLGQERRKTQELTHGGLQQMFAENNVMLTGMDGIRHAINEDF